MNNERPREEDIQSTQKEYERKRRRRQANAPDEAEVIERTLKEKGPMPDQDHEEVEPSGLSSDGRM